MDRSPVFGSATCYYDRAVHTRFRYGSSPEGINLAAHGNLPVHYAKGTPSHVAGPKAGHSASTACRCAVSGTISLSSRLCFSPFPHGTCSLSVAKKYLALGGGPPGFRPGFTCPAVLGKSVTGRLPYAYGPVTLYGMAFQPFLLRTPLSNLRSSAKEHDSSHDPGCATLAGYHAQSV